MPHPTPAETLDAARKLIAKNGWMVLGFTDCADHPGPAPRLAYTAGLTDAGLPELIMTGLDVHLMTEFLNGAARRSLSQEIHTGDLVDGLGSVAFRAVAVDDAWPVVIARKLYGDDRVRLLHLIWPDQGGSYPGEPGWTLGEWQTIPTRYQLQNPIHSGKSGSIQEGRRSRRHR